MQTTSINTAINTGPKNIFWLSAGTISTLLIVFLNASFEAFWVVLMGTFSVPIKFFLFITGSLALLACGRYNKYTTITKPVLITLLSASLLYLYITLHYVISSGYDDTHHIYLILVNWIQLLFILLPLIFFKRLRPIGDKTLTLIYLLLFVSFFLNESIGRNFALNSNWVGVGSFFGIILYITQRNSSLNAKKSTPKHIALILAPLLVYAISAGSEGVTLIAISAIIAAFFPWHQMFRFLFVVAFLATTIALANFHSIFGIELSDINSILSAYFGNSGDISSGRFRIWDAVLTRINGGQDQWTGLGLSALPGRVFDADLGITTAPHNFVYDTLLRIGVIGLIIKTAFLSVLFFFMLGEKSRDLRPITRAFSAGFFVSLLIYDIGGFTHLIGTSCFLIFSALRISMISNDNQRHQVPTN